MSLNCTLPVSAHPLTMVADRLPEAVSLAQLPHHLNRPVSVAGVRLPGWTGGRGFYLGDGQTYVVAKLARSLETPPPWEPLMLRGRWLSDDYGTAWLQVESIQAVQRAA